MKNHLLASSSSSSVIRVTECGRLRGKKNCWAFKSTTKCQLNVTAQVTTDDLYFAIWSRHLIGAVDWSIFLFPPPIMEWFSEFAVRWRICNGAFLLFLNFAIQFKNFVFLNQNAFNVIAEFCLISYNSLLGLCCYYGELMNWSLTFEFFFFFKCSHETLNCFCFFSCCC